MGFFEGKITLFQVLFLLIIPVGIPVLVCFIKPKFVWVSPFIALLIGLLMTAAFYPYYFTDIFNNTIDSTTAYWLYFAVPIHFVVSVLVSSVLYVVRRFGAKGK